jgi:hypothetical protein
MFDNISNLISRINLTSKYNIAFVLINVTDRLKDRKTDRQIDRKTDRQIDR